MLNEINYLKIRRQETYGDLLDSGCFRTNKHSIPKSIIILVAHIPESGAHNYWFCCATSRMAWESMIKELNNLTLPHCRGNRCNTRSQTLSSAPETNATPDSHLQPRSPMSTNPTRRENAQHFESQRFDFDTVTLALHEARLVLDAGYNYNRHEVILRF